MRRVFQSEVCWMFYALLALTSAAYFGALWMKCMVAAVPLMLLVLWEIDRLVHTRYVLSSDGTLTVEAGRWMRPLKLSVADVVSVTPCRSYRIAPALSPRRIVISWVEQGVTRQLQLSPCRQAEFVELLWKKKVSLN